jgi:hypothetical protein
MVHRIRTLVGSLLNIIASRSLTYERLTVRRYGSMMRATLYVERLLLHLLRLSWLQVQLVHDMEFFGEGVR